MRIGYAFVLISVLALAEGFFGSAKEAEGREQRRQNRTKENRDFEWRKSAGSGRNLTHVREILKKRAERAKTKYVLTPQHRRRAEEIGKKLGSVAAKNHTKTITEINEEEQVVDVLFEGDIMLSDEQADALAAEDSQARSKRQAISNTGNARIWDTKTIPYYLDISTGLTEKGIRVIRKGLKFWEDNTCLSFAENEADETAIRFYNGVGCWSYIGKVRPEWAVSQDLSIQCPGCDSIGTVTHELGHALGFYHTQARWDRDDYIEIFTENIQADKVYNCDKETEEDNDNRGLPYEYGSVMHYGLYAFSVDSSDPTKVTLVPKDENYYYTIGSGKDPSFNDVYMMNKLYDCLNCPEDPIPVCQNGGYRDPRNCSRCKCPSGYGGDYCDERPGACGDTLSATSTETNFTIEFGSNATNSSELPDEYDDCVLWIKAPEGNHVVAKVAYMQMCIINAQQGCYWCGVEFKAQQDQTLAGYRYCTQNHLNKEVSSSSTLLPVIIFSRVYKHTYIITYKSEVDVDTSPSTSTSTESTSTSTDSTSTSTESTSTSTESTSTSTESTSTSTESTRTSTESTSTSTESTSTSTESTSTSTESTSTSTESTSTSTESTSTSTESTSTSTESTSTSTETTSINTESTSSGTPSSSSSTTTTSTATTTACVDAMDCQAYLSYCSTAAYKAMMSQKCRKTCGFCGSVATTVATTTAVNGCEDTMNCASYVSYCSVSAYKDMMTNKCKKTCNFCSNVTDTTASGASTTTAGCGDTMNCTSYVSYCTVSAYKDMMMTKCKKTCNFCNDVTSTAASGSSTTTAGCRDEMNCSAYGSYCDVSAYKSMMSQKCRKTCRYCQ